MRKYVEACHADNSYRSCQIFSRLPKFVYFPKIIYLFAKKRDL